jgi:hypothetical protein
MLDSGTEARLRTVTDAAERHRLGAAETLDDNARSRMLKLAADYDRLARLIRTNLMRLETLGGPPNEAGPMIP